MFEREHHRRVAAVLGALDADLLAATACLFGGGTAMALRYGEYREPVDITFLVSDLEGYRTLRQRLTGPDGMRAVARPGMALDQAREVRADPYGVRTMLLVDGVQIKFEVVLEARITLDAPGPDDRVRGVATLRWTWPPASSWPPPRGATSAASFETAVPHRSRSSRPGRRRARWAAQLAFIASARGRVARLQANSPVCWMLRTVSLNPMLAKPMTGGV